MKTAPASRSEAPAGASRPPPKGVRRPAPPVPVVKVHGYQYLVDFGESETPRYHRVNKDKTCSCDEPGCEAIAAVRRYLQAGGLRAPEPPDPLTCPICGGKTFSEPKWDGRYTKTRGWRCKNGGLSHYLQARAERIRQNLAANPWLFPPVPGYPGLRRDEILTAEECTAISRRVFEETGYDPTA